jgi:hypothetical protein
MCPTTAVETSSGGDTPRHVARGEATTTPEDLGASRIGPAQNEICKPREERSTSSCGIIPCCDPDYPLGHHLMSIARRSSVGWSERMAHRMALFVVNFMAHGVATDVPIPGPRDARLKGVFTSWPSVWPPSWISSYPSARPAAWPQRPLRS